MKSMLQGSPGISPLRQRMAAGYTALSALGLGYSLMLAGVPILGHEIGEPALLQVVCLSAASLGLFAGALSLIAGRDGSAGSDAASVADEQPSSAVLGLQVSIEQIDGVVQQQSESMNELRALCGAELSALRAAVTGLAELMGTAIATDRQHGKGMAWVAEDNGQAGLVDEISGFIRRSMAEQSDILAASLNDFAGRLVTEADGPVQTLRGTMTEAANQFAALGNTAAVVRRDVVALNTAGREMAVASATLLSRVGNAVSHVDVSAENLPLAAAAVAAAAEQAARTMAEASAALREDGSALHASGQDSRQAAQAMQQVAAALTASAQTMVTAASEAVSDVTDAAATARLVLAEIPASAASLTSSAERAADTLAQASADLRADATALQVSGQDASEAVQQAAEALAVNAKAIETAGSAMAENAGRVTAEARSALADIPQIVASVTEAAGQVAAILSAASARLRADGASLTSLGLDVQTTTTTLQAASQALADTGYQTIAAVAKAAEFAIAKLGDLLAEAHDDRPDTMVLSGLIISLENAAASLVDSACRLDAAGQRVTEAGASVAGQLDNGSALNEATRHALPEFKAEMVAVVTHLRQETSTLTAAAQRLLSDSAAATDAVTQAASHADVCVSSMDTASRNIGAASTEAALQIERLSAIASHAQTQASLLPEALAEIKDAAARLNGTADAAPLASLVATLPDVAARIETVAVSLGRLTALTPRLEDLLASQPAMRTAESPATQTDDEGVSTILVTTLRRFDAVVRQSEMLMHDAEQLAEAVLSGKAPGVPTLLADRTPALLAEVDAMTNRLRSVATALALTSDGNSEAKRQHA